MKKYDKYYNEVMKVWTIWEVTDYNAKVVKTFKTEKAADNWIRKMGF